MRSPRIILILVLLCLNTTLLFVPYADLREFNFMLSLAPDAHNSAGYSDEVKLLTLAGQLQKETDLAWLLFPLYFPVFILLASFFSKYINRIFSIVLVVLFSIASILLSLITLFLMDFTVFDAVTLHWTAFLIIGLEIFYALAVLLLLMKRFRGLREKITTPIQTSSESSLL
jgi:hypothetical protein